MALLHLVPHALLLVVALWLIWPMIADPIRRRLSARFHPEAPSPDGVADALFVAWSDQDAPRAERRHTA